MDNIVSILGNRRLATYMIIFCILLTTYNVTFMFGGRSQEGDSKENQNEISWTETEPLERWPRVDSTTLDSVKLGPVDNVYSAEYRGQSFGHSLLDSLTSRNRRPASARPKVRLLPKAVGDIIDTIFRRSAAAAGAALKVSSGAALKAAERTDNSHRPAEKGRADSHDVAPQLADDLLMPSANLSSHLYQYHSMPPFNFDILMHNERLCPDKLNFLVYIHTAPSHFSHRNHIRSTWASRILMEAYHYRVVFLLGLPKDNVTQARLLSEQNENGDVVQADFVDSYKNLTYKGLLGLRWASQYCRGAQFVLKTDDDVFVNIPQFLQVLSRLFATSAPRRTILCYQWPEKAMPILRDPAKCMKWCVAEDEFPGWKHYPTYCAGMSFMFTSDLMPVLYRLSRLKRPFWIDDLYITGILPRDLQPPTSYRSIPAEYQLDAQKAMKEYSSQNGSMPTFVLASPDTFSKFYIKLINRVFVQNQKSVPTFWS